MYLDKNRRNKLTRLSLLVYIRIVYDKEFLIILQKFTVNEYIFNIFKMI